MIALVHAAPTTLEPYRAPNLGVLSSPRRFYLNVEGWRWAADNDAYSKWDAGRYRTMLNALADIPGCLFVTAPDVIGDAAWTLRRLSAWLDSRLLDGFPVALVSQDGLNAEQIPWDDLAAFFIGGSDQWKMGDRNRRLVAEAKERGLWIHMGRVNGHQRIRYAKAIGCDSFDGTSMSWFKDRWLRDYVRHAGDGHKQEMIDASPAD
jgi:hypothetical protein